LFEFYLVQGMTKVGTNALCARVLRTRANASRGSCGRGRIASRGSCGRGRIASRGSCGRGLQATRVFDVSNYVVGIKSSIFQ